jgi:hypothetical protein
MKLAIVVDGGNVQSIYTDRSDILVEIDVIDFDNLRAEGYYAIQQYRIMDERIRNMTLVES